MAFYEKFPYTNFQEMNLDRIAERIDDLDTAVSEATASAESAKASEEAAAASEAAAAASEASAAASEASAAHSAAGMDYALEQLEITNARIDNLIVDGTPTEGNTELIDIRTGANGVEYPTAGTAVRTQISDLTDEINVHANGIYPIEKGERLLPTFNFYVGEKWPLTGNVVQDSKYGRTGRISGYASSKVLCLENSDYEMSIGAYSATSGTVENISSRFEVKAFQKFALIEDWTAVALNFKRVDGHDITSADGDIIKNSVIIYDVVDAESYYTKNLIGNIAGAPYPVCLPPGTKFTVATSDGSEFDGSIQITTLDENKEQISYWTLSSGLTSRTITTLTTRGTAYYVRINKPSSVPLMMSYGDPRPDAEYKPYFPPNKALTDREYLGAEKRKIKICTWNVGNFSYGDSGVAQGTDAMREQFVSTFKTIGADIYTFDEWDSYWNQINDIQSSDVLGDLKPYWTAPRSYSGYVLQKIASDFPITYENYNIYSGDPNHRAFNRVIHNICGKNVHVYSTHLPFNSWGLRRDYILELQDYIQNSGAEYVIVCGDMNGGLSTQDNPPTTAEEMYTLLDDERTLWTTIGYKPVQGGFWGPYDTRYYINTGKTELTDIYPVRAYDNIIVSPNIAVVNAYSVDSDASDHMALVADIVLLD